MTADDPRARLLAIYDGALVVMAVKRCNQGETSHCPICGGTQFEDGPYDWTDCVTCYRFRFSTSGYRRLISADANEAMSNG